MLLKDVLEKYVHMAHDIIGIRCTHGLRYTWNNDLLGKMMVLE